uniref:hypothetical protein n=1 Tax=Clavibacter michiganensis TaxID=28447 RepID=UPI00292D0936
MGGEAGATGAQGEGAEGEPQYEGEERCGGVRTVVRAGDEDGGYSARADEARGPDVPVCMSGVDGEGIEVDDHGAGERGDAGGDVGRSRAGGDVDCVGH